MKKKEIPKSKIYYYWSMIFLFLAVFPLLFSLFELIPEGIAIGLTALAIAFSSLNLSISTKARLVEIMESVKNE